MLTFFSLSFFSVFGHVLVVHVTTEGHAPMVQERVNFPVSVNRKYPSVHLLTTPVISVGYLVLKPI